MIATIHSVKLVGTRAVNVSVECEVRDSGIGIHLVGLADTAVKQSLLRTVTALQANGYRIPGKKVVVNLTPTDLCKNGSGYDLPIALALIAASGQRSLPFADGFIIRGELCLDGALRPTGGGVCAALLAREQGKDVILPPPPTMHVRPPAWRAYVRSPRAPYATS